MTNKISGNYVALAIAVYVLVYALIETSQAVWGSVSNVNKASRLLLFDRFELFGRNPPLGIMAMVVAALSVLLMLLLILYFVKVWSLSIELTRRALKVWLANKTHDPGPEEQQVTSEGNVGDAIEYLEGLVWRLVRSLMFTWLLIILIEFFSNLNPVQS